MENKAILNFFYSKATNRIKEQYERANCPKYDDIIESNPKLLSYILNCKTTEKNNPYLLTDGAIYALKKSDYFNFKNETEILWGKEEEIESYIEDLFILLWQEYITFYEKIDSEFKCDYLPFVKYYVLNKKISDENKEFSEVLFELPGGSEGENYEMMALEAIKYVFRKNKNWFKSEWKKFIETHKTYTKLNKKIYFFVKESLVPYLEKNSPSAHSSLGIRAKTLLEADLSVKDQEIKVWGGNNDDQVKFQLFKASVSYVNHLERIFELQNKDIN